MTLVALKSHSDVTKYLAHWQQVLRKSAESAPGKNLLIPRANIWAQLVKTRDSIPSTRLGMMGNRKRASVEISLPSTKFVGTTNPLTTVAVERTAKHSRVLLLRQGFLRSYRGVGLKDIVPSHFERLTSATKVALEIKGNPRPWYVVCELTASDATILRQTASFVSECAEVRSLWANSTVLRRTLEELDPPSSEDEERMERRGTIIVPPQKAKEIDKVHAGVWEDLKAEAKRRKITARKLKDTKGAFEIDMVLTHGAKKVLVEIKTASTATDIYTAIGQLKSYSTIFADRLAGHMPVLLLPKYPANILRKVLADNGITVALYGSGKPNTFRPALWSLLSPYSFVI